MKKIRLNQLHTQKWMVFGPVSELMKRVNREAPAADIMNTTELNKMQKKIWKQSKWELENINLWLYSGKDYKIQISEKQKLRLSEKKKQKKIKKSEEWKKIDRNPEIKVLLHPASHHSRPVSLYVCHAEVMYFSTRDEFEA